ncbi:hypothetical protein Clacol_008876 [Clathrus columnatus]|uniref:C2H2-type domain-containing protein n=1 Tax=Clathrus columnatus TaxID=1419009 RepID=A0AAV5AJP6_9AGAM|nr:hypothetical protein Clacol_008876 [Clathrus columnatus]
METETTSSNYWSSTPHMEFQEIPVSNPNYMQHSGNITDPWNITSQTTNFHDMDVSSPYVSSPSLSLGVVTTNFTGSSYPYPHFQTNNMDNHPFRDQDTPISPMTSTHNSGRPIPSLPHAPPSSLPHLMDSSQRVGLSEMWSLQGMRDMEAFERSCSNTNMLRMKPRPPKKTTLATNAAATTLSLFETNNNDQSSTSMIQAENAGCNAHNAFPLVAAMTDTLGSQPDTSLVKPEYTHPDQLVSYHEESTYQDTVASNNFSSAMSYRSTSSFASPDPTTISSPIPEPVVTSPIAASPMSPTMPSPMTVPSQSPIASRPTLRHLNILPAPSKHSVPTLTINLGLNSRQRRVSAKASLVGHRGSDASPRNELHSDTNGSVSPDISKSTIQNGPSQVRTMSSGPDSSKPPGSTRSRRNPRPNSNRSNSIPVSDGSSSPEHKLTETHSIPAADLDNFFYLPEQGCIGGRKAWMCPKCKKFVRKQDRTSHKLGHEGKKRYDCRCGKQFGRPQDADRHIREQAPCRRCQGKMGRYGKDGFCSACVMETEQGQNGT